MIYTVDIYHWYFRANPGSNSESTMEVLGGWVDWGHWRHAINISRIEICLCWRNSIQTSSNRKSDQFNLHPLLSDSTVNVCSIDLSKAFDRINHYALIYQASCVTFGIIRKMVWAVSNLCSAAWTHMTEFFKLIAGVRQGGILSPFFFLLFLLMILLKKFSLLIWVVVCPICLY